MPSKLKKKMRQRKRKERKGEKAKVKVESVVLLLNPKTVEILFSAHARTLQALILHLAEKAAECTTWKRVCREI